MVDFGSTTTITCCAVLGGALTAFAETLHAKRVRLSAPLAFGPSFQPANWTQALPALRAILIAGAIWGLMTLISLDGSRAQSQAEGERHLFVLLDVSPSMLIEDAGPERNQRRSLRAAEVLESVLNRAPGNHLKISLSAFYTTQKPLIQESIDRNLILYMAKDLPLHIAFKAGKTNLLEALNKTAAQCSKLKRGSTTLLVISDGDTVSDTGLEALPPSIDRVLIAGIGDTAKGQFIDSHLSRQDTASLAQLARRLRGQFHDANTRHIASESLTSLLSPASSKGIVTMDAKTTSIAVIALAAALQALIPFLLQHAGAPTHPARAISHSKPSTIQ